MLGSCKSSRRRPPDHRDGARRISLRESMNAAACCLLPAASGQCVGRRGLTDVGRQVVDFFLPIAVRSASVLHNHRVGGKSQ